MPNAPPSGARVWTFLAEQEVLEVVENIHQERISDNMPSICQFRRSNSWRLLVKLVFFWLGANDVVGAAFAAFVAVAQSVGEA